MRKINSQDDRSYLVESAEETYAEMPDMPASKRPHRCAEKRRTTIERVVAIGVLVIAAVITITVIVSCISANAQLQSIEYDGGAFLEDVAAWTRHEITASEVGR